MWTMSINFHSKSHPKFISKSKWRINKWNKHMFDLVSLNNRAIDLFIIHDTFVFSFIYILFFCFVDSHYIINLVIAKHWVQVYIHFECWFTSSNGSICTYYNIDWTITWNFFGLLFFFLFRPQLFFFFWQFCRTKYWSRKRKIDFQCNIFFGGFLVTFFMNFILKARINHAPNDMKRDLRYFFLLFF